MHFAVSQNNWGTYGDETGFNIFEMSTNDKGEPMLKHAPSAMRPR